MVPQILADWSLISLPTATKVVAGGCRFGCLGRKEII